MNRTALPKEGREANKDEISFRIAGNALIDLKGLKTRTTLNALIAPAASPNAISVTPAKTTIKSSQFQ